MKTVIKHIVPNPKGRLIAVSDIHGYVHYLEGLLQKLSFTKEDTLVIVGDMIEKGPESLKTVRYVLKLIEEGYSVYAVKGNVDSHRIGCFLQKGEAQDQASLDLLKWTKQVWKRGFFVEIAEELGVSVDTLSIQDYSAFKAAVTEHYRKEIDYLSQLPVILTAGNFIFVHGGIPTDDLHTLQGTDAESYLKFDAFWQQGYSFKKYVVVGHWPVCLYRMDEINVSPLYDAERHIVSIDGGCALKMGAQLNALVLPANCTDMENACFEYYDDYPVIEAAAPQEGMRGTVRITYADCNVEELSRTGDMVRLRHISSGREFSAPVSYLFSRNGKLKCDDFSDAMLPVEKGDLLAVLQKTSDGYIAKKDGVIGWYRFV